jgi:YcxB-like protein
MSADAPVFTLSYDAELDDLIEWARMDPRRKRARNRMAWSIVASLVIVGAITVLSVVLSRPSATGQAAPTWLLYLVVTFGWLRIVRLLRKLWQLSPDATGRHTWQAEPAFHGPHQEEVSQSGILGLGQDQEDVFYPWADLTAVEETSRAFYVHHGTGVAVVLPKRGLPDTSQIPELREFLHRAVAAGQDPAAATD